MNALKLEPFSGVSGDLFLGALVGLVPEGKAMLAAVPGLLGLAAEVEVRIRQVNKCGVAAVKVDVVDPASGRPVEHAQKGGHGRHLSSILETIASSGLSKGAQDLSKRIFLTLGEAEAGVHGVPVERIHFHEVGALDAIVDVCGAAVLLDRLAPSRVFSSPVRTGRGFVRAAHGLLPIPAPATARLLEGMPVWAGDVDGEFTTPTGAAILRVLAPDFTDPVVSAGPPVYGAGSRDCVHPNVLRASLVLPSQGEEDVPRRESGVIALRSNIDNTSGEWLGADFQERLFAAGALDFTLTPAQMKKGRPAWVLEVLTPLACEPAVVEQILLHTATIGVRRSIVDRWVLPREAVRIPTPYGEIVGKKVLLPGGGARIQPEWESLRQVAAAAAVPVAKVLELGRISEWDLL